MHLLSFTKTLFSNYFHSTSLLHEREPIWATIARSLSLAVQGILCLFVCFVLRWLTEVMALAKCLVLTG